MIIAIDGPAGCGKSTAAKNLAKALHILYFETGAMYRAFTFYLLQNQISLEDDKNIKKLLKNFTFSIHEDADGNNRYFIHKEEVTSVIRTPEVASAVSKVSAKKYLRKKMVQLQRAFVKDKDVVIEGRDIGSVVFPKADFKFYFTASSQIRAQRRYEEYLGKYPDMKEVLSRDKILQDIEKRDHFDSTRKASPLKIVKGAIKIDTSHLSIEEVKEVLLQSIQKIKPEFFYKRRRYIPPFSKMRLFYAIVIFFSWVYFKLFYRLKIYGQEHFVEGRAIIAANHVSYLDPPIVSTSFPEEVHFLAKASLFKIPLFGFLIKKLNAHPVVRDTADVKAMKMITEILCAGKKVIIFPEGERTVDGKIGPILPGIGFLVLRTKASVIPVYIHGAYQAWPCQKKLPKLFGKISCVFGSPIDHLEFVHLQKREAMEAISKRISEKLLELEAYAEKGFIGLPP